MYNCYIKETGKTITIVICDDSSLVTRQITEYLHAYMQTIPTSLQLYSFSDGHSLISSFQKGNDFDICFLDILMPGFSGMETAREIRHFNTHTRIIFLTSSPEYALESYEVRAYDYILKPVTPERMNRLMNEVLKEIKRKHRDSQELLKQFFTCPMGDEKRWDFIESYFLGREEELETYLMESSGNC